MAAGSRAEIEKRLEILEALVVDIAGDVRGLQGLRPIGQIPSSPRQAPCRTPPNLGDRKVVDLLEWLRRQLEGLGEKGGA